MTAHRPFNYRRFLADYRAACITNGLNPRTGYPLETEAIYRQDDQGRRVLVRIPVLPDPEPEVLCDPASPTWWANPAFFNDAGPAHSSVEAAAISSIARQARAIAGVPEPVATATDLPPTMAARLTELAEDGARRLHQLELPLRELHAMRGETVELVAGQRMLVPIRKTA